MPNDTTIYWDGYGPLPAEIDSLPPGKQQQVLAVIYKKREELNYNDYSATYIAAIAILLVFSLAIIYKNFKSRQAGTLAHADDNLPVPATQNAVLVYTGNMLRFTDSVIAGVLIKRFPYYNLLEEPDKVKFIRRLKKFISVKTFVIHDSHGFKEMPILISAVAVQISFGLDKYLLPNFDTFNIYPNEFIGTYPFIRFLIGNVTGNTINLSWKHFLEGFQYPDGQNVGIHEIAHALYYQTFVVEKNIDKDFRDTFIDFDSHGNKVYDIEKLAGNGLYTEYAMKDFQEFWAESVEIFFEKPVQMKAVYPNLYRAMTDLLNQDPASTSFGNIA